MSLKFRTALILSVLFGMIGLAKADCGDEGITLNQPSVSGKVISFSGAWGKGTYTFKGIWVFVVPKAGGTVAKGTVAGEPKGKDWPESGTVNVTVTHKGTYQVWAVIGLQGDGPIFYMASAIREVTISEGDTPPASEVTWGTNQPSTSMGTTISGSGTISNPAGSTGHLVVFLVWPAAGGLMVGPSEAVPIDLMANPPTWGASSVSGLNQGTSYNVSVTYGYTNNGNPFHFATPVTPITP